MYCNNCGCEAKDTDKYCNNCGAKLEFSSNSIKTEEDMKAEVFSNSLSKIIDNNEKKDTSEFTPNNGNYESNYRDTKKNKKIPVLILAILILVISLGVFAFVKKDELFYSKTGKRTIMIYMIGSDLESEYLAATKDIDEIIDSNVNFDDVNILIYTGGTKKWHYDNIPNNKQALFKINEDGLVKIEEYDSTSDMLDSSNVSFLLNYGYNHYDTEYYDLILWDHGAGPIYGYGYDEYNKMDSMSLLDLQEALKNSPFNGVNKLEFIGFDACLMSSIEVASVLSDYSDYMIASQEFEPGLGWDYSFLSTIDSSTTTLDVGKTIIDYYSNFYESKKNVKGVTLALLKLNKVENVENSLNNLFTNMDEEFATEFSSISRTRSRSKSFGRISGSYYYYDLIDLNDLIDNLPEKYYESGNLLKASLEDLVIYQKTDLEKTNGISIYFPYENKTEIVSNMKLYKEIGFAPAYYEYISNFSAKLTGRKVSDWDLTKSKIESTGEGVVSITLPKDVVNNYSSADYIIFEKGKDQYFTPIFNGSDVELNGNKLSTTIAKKSLVAKNNNEDELYLTAIESQKGINFVKYHIPATLSKWDSKTLDLQMIAVYLEFVVDEANPNGYVASVLPMDLNENYTYSKMEINLKDWDTVTLLSYKYLILNKKGKYTPKWENSEEVVNMQIDTSEKLNISFVDLDISKDYYCIFRVKDSQGNVYLSNIVKINNK